jgi:hypothetical protein
MHKYTLLQHKMNNYTYSADVNKLRFQFTRNYFQLKMFLYILIGYMSESGKYPSDISLIVNDIAQNTGNLRLKFKNLEQIWRKMLT